MAQGWNRQLQNIQRLIDAYANELRTNGFTLGESGELQRPVNFRLGQSGPLHTGKTVPTVYQPQQPQIQQMLTGSKTPLLTTSGKPLPSPIKTITDFSGKQTGYILPNGQVTSSPELVNIAKQQVAKANKQALTKTALKGLGVVPTAVEFYKDLAFPVANDLYKGFIKGDTENSRALQIALGLAGLDKNGKPVPRETTKKTDDVNKKANDLINGLKSENKGSVNTGVTGTAAPIQQQMLDAVNVQPQQEMPNLQAVNDYISQLQNIQQPYVDALQKYLNNYNDLYNRSANQQRIMAAMSGLSGNANYAKIAGEYNPLKQEANRIAAIKQLQDAQAGDLNAINEVIGNMEVAQRMGMSPEAAFANKNLLSAMTMRDRNLTNREIAELNNAAKLQIALENYKNRLAVQGMRGNTARDVALINAMAYGAGVAPGLNAQGGMATPQDVALNQILSQAQQQNR